MCKVILKTLLAMILIAIFAFIAFDINIENLFYTDNSLENKALKTVKYSKISIVSSQGIHHNFKVEIANTQKDRAKGLMFRKKLPKDQGMLFIMDISEIANFWMKNTFIPLDIIFIDSNDKIVKIAKNVSPLSKKNISSVKPVTKVLEINANLSDKLGINIGDSLLYDN